MVLWVRGVKMGPLVYVLMSFFVTVLGLSDFRRCADPKCAEKISEASVVLAYVASEAGRVSVRLGDSVAVYSKEAGNDTSLWGVEVRGKRGYIPKTMIKETRVIHKNLPYVVGTEIGSPSENFMPNNNGDQTPSVPLISNSFSVVDGTTIYGNTSDNGLETEPIETIAVNVVQSDNIQSSKTIDATRISENKLDEPNSSIILSQPTTSTQNEMSIEDIKESTNNTDVSENKKEENVSSDSNEFVGEDNENEEKHNNYERENIGSEAPNAQGSEEEDAKDENDDYEDDEEDEEGQGLETEEIEDEDDEGKDKIEIQNSKEHEGIHEKSGDSVTESSGTNFEETYVSEQEILQSSGESASVDSGQMEVEIPRENVDTRHQEEHVEDVNKLFQSGDSPTSPNRMNEPNKSEMNVDFSQDDYVNKADHLSDAYSDEKKYNTERPDPNEYSSETFGGLDELLEINVNLTNNSDTSNSDLSSKVSSSSNTADSENFEGGEEEKTVLNPYTVLEKLNKIEKLEDVESGKKQSYVSETSSDEELQDIPIAKGNIMTEKTSTVNEFQVNGDLYSSPAEDSFPEALEVDDLGQTENEESAFIDNDIQEYDSSMLINTPETSVEVQGTCAVDVVGCAPENEDISKQLSRSEEAEQGWLTPLFETANVIAGILVPSTAKAMYKNNLDIFQTTQSFLIVTAITVLVFTLGYYYLEKQRRDGFLKAKINSLEKELMVSSQEKYSLKDELENTREKLSTFITSVDSGETSSRETSSILKEELEECQAARLELEEQVATLEKELEAATEAGLELNRMMSELLSAQHGSDTLMKSVEHLQKQLDSQQTTINTMTANLKAKNLENESLQSELKLTSEHVQNLEDQLAKVNEALTNLQKEKTEIEHDFQAKNQSIELQLVEALESKSADSQRLCRELDALQDVLDETRKTLSAREGEVSVLQECLNHVECVSNGGESGISLEELLNVGHLRGMIDNVTKERDELLEKLQGEEDARKLLEDHMKIVSEEVSTLRSKYEEADRGKSEAQTRLEVLSNYFKEKETQLQKELGLQEAMYIQKEGDALSTIEQIKAFQEEIENYKAQNEILKKEILDQERSMKSQIAMLEKKAHENWVAARQAERRLEESKQESTQLRNRLTMSGHRLVGTIPGPDVGKPPERGTLDLEHNGEISSSPAHMGEMREMPASPLHFGLPGSPPPLLPPPGGQPLPPGLFPGLPLFLSPGAPGMPFSLPPPPGALFPDDLRPPPLGRMSSPPPEPRGSFSPFEHSPPMSPRNRPYRSPPRYEDSPRRYRHLSPPSSAGPSFPGPFSPGKWEERSDLPRSSFRPLHRDSPREPKGSNLSSGHSSESLDKGSRHSRV